MRTLAAVAILTVVVLTGCSGEDPFDTGPTRSAAPEAMGISTGTVESMGAPVAKKESSEPAPKPEPKREKAKAGVTGRGDYGGGLGTTALSTRVRTEERVRFMEVDKAMSLYKATNGELPKSHDEFMEKIIKANQIKLPELREEDKYVYDPEKGELLVEKGEKQ